MFPYFFLAMIPAFIAGWILAAYYDRPALLVRNTFVFVLAANTFGIVRLLWQSEFSMTGGQLLIFALVSTTVPGLVGYTVSAFVSPWINDLLFLIRTATFEEPCDT